MNAAVTRIEANLFLGNRHGIEKIVALDARTQGITTDQDLVSVLPVDMVSRGVRQEGISSLGEVFERDLDE